MKKDSNDVKKVSKFAQLGLSASTLAAIARKGFEEPTEIQEKIIPLLLKDETDIIGQAPTGVGKTAVFGLFLVDKLKALASVDRPRAEVAAGVDKPSKGAPAGADKPAKGTTGSVQCLILVPTRELALQVAEEINSLKGDNPLSIVPIYGGQDMKEQLRRLNRGVDIVVGTPGRVLDHLDRKSLKLDKVSYVVLDEADEMLNMGFIDDVEKILKSTPPKRRVLLFSATMPKRVLQIAERNMGKKQTISVERDQLATQLTNQIYFEVAQNDKFEALCRIIDVEPDFYGIVFCRTKVDVDTVASHLAGRGYSTEALHGDITQGLREKMLQKFRKRLVNIMVATDVAARGIDINDLTHVINFSLPQQPEAYIHRIGRTGRAGKEGTAITFITPDEYRKLLFIQKITKADIKKQTLPRASEVVKVKTKRILDDMQEIIAAGEYNDYLKLAQELVANQSVDVVVASLLKYCFQDELEEQSYAEIREVSIKKNINRKGTTRLFVALGRKDQLTPQKLSDMICQKTSVENRNLRNIEIFEKFSLLTVPFEDAEIILNMFKNQHGKPPMIRRAKEER